VTQPLQVLSLREAQRRNNPSSWIATPSFLGLAMANRSAKDPAPGATMKLILAILAAEPSNSRPATPP